MASLTGTAATVTAGTVAPLETIGAALLNPTETTVVPTVTVSGADVLPATAATAAGDALVPTTIGPPAVVPTAFGAA